MSKPPLGRGLGNLLGSNDRTPQQPSSRLPGVGLRILIDGAQRETQSSRAAAPASTSTPNARTEIPNSKKENDGELLTRVFVVAALVSADIALLGWAAHHAFTHQQALSSAGIAACLGSGMAAALCGCAATLIIAGPD